MTNYQVIANEECVAKTATPQKMLKVGREKENFHHMKGVLFKLNIPFVVVGKSRCSVRSRQIFDGNICWKCG